MLGDALRDKRQAGHYEATQLTSEEIRQMWRSEDMAARIIETKPKEAWRRGFEVVTDDKEQSELIGAACEDLGVASKFYRARCLENAYGGSAIFPVLNDGQRDLSQPLRENGGISKISHLHVLEARELQPVGWYDDITSPKFGEPSHFALQPLSGRGRLVSRTTIHESRLIVFPGIRVSREEHEGGEPGWGDSVIVRPYEVLRDFGQTWGNAAALLQDFAQGVIKLKGLAALMNANQDDIVAKRLVQMDAAKSMFRSMVMDAEDNFERKTTSLVDLPEMLDRFAQRLSAASGIPVPILMGEAAGGLNATGDAIIRWFYDAVDGDRQQHDLPRLERMVKLIMLSNGGPTDGVEPEVWSAVFRPLWQPTDKETAEVREAIQRIDVAYIDAGVYSPEEVREKRFCGDTFSIELQLTMDDYEPPDEVDVEAMAELAAVASARQLPPGAQQKALPPGAEEVESETVADGVRRRRDRRAKPSKKPSKKRTRRARA